MYFFWLCISLGYGFIRLYTHIKVQKKETCTHAGPSYIQKGGLENNLTFSLLRLSCNTIAVV